MERHFNVVIIGGGTAGITVAARLRRQAPDLGIAVVEPSDRHYYQPLWTLVGGGVVPLAKSVRPMSRVMPRGTTWLRDAALRFQPTQNRIETASGATLRYDFLVVAPGIQIDWRNIPGLTESLGKNGVCSNYSPDTAEYTWTALRELREGNALFTFPNTPVKCAGAPQKIMYLAEHYLRRKGLRNRVNIIFASAGTSIFAVPKYAAALSEIVRKRHIETRFQHNLVAVDGPNKTATFRNPETGENVTLPFSLLHAVPPMSPPDILKNSPLGNETGWVDVHKYTLQHNRFPNIFSLGDASSLPTSKTGAAVRKQAPVLVHNLLRVRRGENPDASYDGYTSCPLVTGYGKLILAEFDYDGKPRETFPFDQSKERLSMYLLKKHVLPQLYWKGMLKGRA